MVMVKVANTGTAIETTWIFKKDGTLTSNSIDYSKSNLTESPDYTIHLATQAASGNKRHRGPMLAPFTLKR